MLKNFNNNHLQFEKVSLNNDKHLRFISEFGVDKEVNEYFDEWNELVELSINNDDTIFAYIISYDEKMIGLCTFCFSTDYQVVFSQGLLEEARGNNYAALIRNAAIEYLKTEGVTEIVGYIRKDNKNIIRNIIKNGYEMTQIPNSELLEIKYLNLEKHIRR